MTQSQFPANNNLRRIVSGSSSGEVPSVEQILELAKRMSEQSIAPPIYQEPYQEVNALPGGSAPITPFRQSNQNIPLGYHQEPFTPTPYSTSQHDPRQSWGQSGVIDVPHHTIQPTQVDPNNYNPTYLHQYPIANNTNTTRYNNQYQPSAPHPSSGQQDILAFQEGWKIALTVVVGCCVLSWAMILMPARNGEHRDSKDTTHPQQQKEVASSAPKKFVLLPSLKVGDKVGVYRVSSGFGYRVHPVTGVTRLHAGIDVAGPQGLIYHFPGLSGRVECFTSDQTLGGGNVAQIFSTDPKYAGYTDFKMMHMEDGSCIPGPHKAGDMIGRLGSTGLSTGPHGHAGAYIMEPKKVKDKKGGYKTIYVRTPVPPPAVMIYEAFGAKPPNTKNKSSS